MSSEKTYKECSAEDAHKLVEGGSLLLDVRTPEEFSKGHVEGAVNVPYKIFQEGEMVLNPNFTSQAQEALPDDKSKPIVCTCFAGARGGSAAAALNAAGFQDVTNVEKGMNSWVKAGLPCKGEVNPPSAH